MMTRANHFRMLAIVVAVAVALTLALALQDPAYSDITLTVNITSDAVDINPGDGRCDVDLHDQELVLLGEGDLGGSGFALNSSPGPSSSCCYSPECVEGEFLEVRKEDSYPQLI